MGKQLYVSRDRYSVSDEKELSRFKFWKMRPKWLSDLRMFYPRGCKKAIAVAAACPSLIKELMPHLNIEPGQIATVNREEVGGVVKLTLGEIIESH